MNIKKISFSALCIALAFVLSKIKLLEFFFPLGGSITLFSMLIITLPGYFLGFKYGVLSTIGLGIIKFSFAGNLYNIWQGILDYIIAYTLFSVSGLKIFTKMKRGLECSYILGVIGRILFCSLSGYIFFRESIPVDINPIIYVLMYNASYMVVEMVITLIVINIPYIRRGIINLKQKVINW